MNVIDIAIQKAFEFGGTDEGNYILTDEELREVIAVAMYGEVADCEFIKGQLLKCVTIPDRHEGYFTVGESYAVSTVDHSDTALPLKMKSDRGITLWCEAEAFVAVS